MTTRITYSTQEQSYEATGSLPIWCLSIAGLVKAGLLAGLLPAGWLARLLEVAGGWLVVVGSVRHTRRS